VLNEQYSIQSARNPTENIKTRIKSQESVREQMVRKGMHMNLGAMTDEMTDIAGVRVVCSFVDDIYMLADCLLQQDDLRLVKRTDYIRCPKENGYRSLHLVVEVPIYLQNEKRFMPVEVQLRTIAMELWANLEHKMRYKKNLSAETIDKISDELLLCAEQCAQLDEKMLQIRNRIGNDSEE